MNERMRVAVVVLIAGVVRRENQCRMPAVLSRGRRLLSRGVVRDHPCWSKVERKSVSVLGRTPGSLAVTWLPMGADGKARGSHIPTDTNTLEGRNMILSI